MASPTDSSSPDPFQSAVMVAAMTDVGMRRRNNQDSLAVHLADGRAAWERAGHLFIVADGMGAHAAGELASRLAVDLVQHHYEKQHLETPIENLHRAVIEANNEIYRRGQANIEFRHMGTTCSALALTPLGAICGHVGDSRIYRLRKNRLEQLTFDHSLVWEAFASGGLDEEALRSSVLPKNVITRSLGPNASVVIDLEGPFPIQIGDRFLICSDGLSGQLTDTELGVLMQVLPPPTAAQAMLDLANLRGGPDNISLIIIEVVGDEVVTLSQRDQESRRGRHQPLRLSPPQFVLIGMGFLGGIILFLAGLRLVAVIAWVISLAVLGIAALQRSVQQSAAGKAKTHYGRGPYRQFVCNPDAMMIERLAGTVHALRDAAVENQWVVAKEVIERQLPDAAAAASKKDFAKAMERYALVMIDAMKAIRTASHRAPSLEPPQDS